MIGCVEGGLPGALAAPGAQWEASLHGQRIRSLAEGVVDAVTGSAVVGRTMFLSASTTKLLTAILALQAARRGELSLQAPIGAWLPDAPGAGRVSLAMLLSHRSGLPNPNPLGWVHLATGAESFDNQAALAAVLARSQVDDPGTGYRYSNLGYWLAGAVLEQATGLAFPALVADRLLAPLGLTAADMSVALPRPEVLARGHLRRFGPVHALLRLLYPWQIEHSSGRWEKLATLLMNGPAYGGIFARAEAYLRLGEDLLSPASRLLTAEDRDALLDPREPEPHTANPFGLKVGRLKGKLHLGKPGGGPGFAANLRLYPETGLVSVWMANALCFSEREIEARSDRLDQGLI
jgi:D-alanyl-D-alanine carboxypeptidase